MFADIFSFLTADVLQQYANTDSRSLAAREFCKMWRYFNKMSAPPREKSSKYKQEQQKRAFLPSWQQNRLWLNCLDESLIKIESLIEK